MDTVMLPVPEAVGATLNVAVICVVLTTFTLLIDNQGVLVFTVIESGKKFVPVMVTSTVLPAGALLGLMELMVGEMELTIPKVVAAEVAPEEVTVTSAVPEAFAAITKVAVI